MENFIFFVQCISLFMPLQLSVRFVPPCNSIDFVAFSFDVYFLYMFFPSLLFDPVIFQ